MNAHRVKELMLVPVESSSDKNDEYNIPLCISDLILICQEYNKLGQQIQNQVENILEIGVEESIKNGIVKQESLPQIKRFLKSVYDVNLLGDAASQARDCYEIIMLYEEHLNKKQYNKSLN